MVGTPGAGGILQAIADLISIGLDTAPVPAADAGSPYVVCPANAGPTAVGDANDCLVSVRYRAGATPADVVILDGVTEVARIKAANQTANTEDTVYFGWKSASTGWNITCTAAGTSAVAAYNVRP